MLSIWSDWSIDSGPRGLSSSEGLTLGSGPEFLKTIHKIVPDTIEGLDVCYQKIDRYYDGSYALSNLFDIRPGFGYIFFYENYKGVHRANSYIELSTVVSEIRNNKIDKCLNILS